MQTANLRGPINTLACLLDNEIEAQLMDGILTERGIPHYMKSYHSDAYDGLFQMVKGWGAIHAPKEYQEEIQEILLDVQNASPEEFDSSGD